MSEKSSIFNSQALEPSHLVDIHPALNEVRTFKEFQSAHPHEDPLAWLFNSPWIKQLQKDLDTTLDKLLSAFTQLFSKMGPINLEEHQSTFAEVLRWSLIGLIAFVVVLLLYFILVIVRKHLLSAEIIPQRILQTADGSFLINSTYHLRMAQEKAGNHSFEEAVRHLYLGLLCLLDETQLIPFEANRTNWEYLHLLRKGKFHAFYVPFQALTLGFETIQYGHQPCSADRYHKYYQAFQSLQSLIHQEEPLDQLGKS